MAADDIIATRNRGGRPKAADPRTHRVVLHLTAAEVDALTAKAAGQPLAAFVRDVALASRRRAVVVPAVNAEVAAHVAAIGNNVNQLTRQANVGIVTDPTGLLIELRHTLDEVWRAVLGRGGEP